ncbi:MAG: 4-hydroxythreonine-4-phosphate dehydrogenase PdxA [Nitrospirae bacterium]|nr:4-hydroxythreonine-4-phosphate dehydrogenase PdxA [Nitrospirota bacterium]
MGDPAGIGPEIILKALASPAPFRRCRPILFGHHGLFTREIRRLRLPLRLEIIDGSSGWSASPGRLPPGRLPPDCLPIVPIEHAGALPRPGRLSAAGGRLAARAIERATAWAQAGRLDAITTGPIHKVGLARAGYPFEGHTEFLAALTGSGTVGMMMVGGGLRIMLATIHLAVRDLPRRLTTQKILTAIRLTHRAMRDWFGAPHAAIGVSGLNPHAGDRGRFGDEEARVIAPAIARARRSGIRAAGPYPADTLFHRAHQGEFDATVAMYHDQALIPIKLLAFGRAVNLTVGLPFVRTSVDHGTAYDIAGKGIADPGSLLEALELAANLAKKRIKD